MPLNAKSVCAALTIFLLVVFGLAILFPTKEGFATPYPASNRTRGMPCYNDRQCRSGVCSQEKCT